MCEARPARSASQRRTFVHRSGAIAPPIERIYSVAYSFHRSYRGMHSRIIPQHAAETDSWIYKLQSGRSPRKASTKEARFLAAQAEFVPNRIRAGIFQGWVRTARITRLRSTFPSISAA